MHFGHRRKLCYNGTCCALGTVVALSPGHRKRGTWLHRTKPTAQLSEGFHSDFSGLHLDPAVRCETLRLCQVRLSAAPFST